jgi:hypothetical protein
MEAAFQFSFASVRVHDDAVAHKAAAELGARAYTIGRDIGFARGEYAPTASGGQRLLAHELAHVVQQSGLARPMVQCAPVLSKRTPAEILGDDKIAGDVDQALADSKTVTAYVDDPKKMRKAKGHFHVEFKETFERNEQANAKEVGASPKGDSGDKNTITKGFTDLKRGEIHLRERVANVEGAVHEAIHLNSKQSSDPFVSAFQKSLGHPMEEGVTQYFTNKVLDEQGIGAGVAYPGELAMAEGLIACVGEALVGKAYFKGESEASKAVSRQFNQAHSGPGAQYGDWYTASRSKDADDWKRAAKILKTVFGK